MSNRYSFGIHTELEPQQLFFLVFLDTALKHFGLEEMAAMGAVIAGQPIIPTRGKFRGATPNTSLASVVSRRMLPFDLERRILPTVTMQSMKQLRIIFVRNIGAFVGRTIPVIGVVMLAYDAYCISTEALRAYNLLVREEDKVFG